MFYVGILGAAILLVAFALSQLHFMDHQHIYYDIMNAVGAICLVLYAFDSQVWPFFVLNTVWAFFGLYDIYQELHKRRHKKFSLFLSKHLFHKK